MSKTFQSLSFHNYRIWFFGALVANVGTWMQRIAQDWLVLRILTDNSGFSVGVVTALQFAPLLVLTPIAGVLADRVNRRKLLMWTQAGMGTTAVMQGILVLGGHAQLWHIYALALILGSIAAIDAPARQIFVGEMVPPSSLPNAVALNSTSFNAARLVGPGISGLLIAAVGTGWVFLINAASFAATIGALMMMRTSELRELPKAPRAKGQIRDGLRYVRRRTDIMVIMIVAGVVSALGLNFQLTSAVMATEVFGREATGYGIVGSIMAIGSVAGALAAARRTQPRVRLVIVSAFVFGIAAGINALSPTWELYLLSSIAVGFCSLTMITSANTAIQMSTEPAMRGRVMSLYTLVFLGTTPIGSPLVGWIAQTFSARWSVGIGALASMIVAAGAGIWAKRNWRVAVHYQWHRPYVDISGPGERAALRAENLVAHAEEIVGDAGLNASRTLEEHERRPDASRIGKGAHRPREPLTERGDVVGADRGEGSDPDLIASERAVSGDVENADATREL